jgi:hypothetical protein
LYVDQEIGPNDKDLSTFESPVEALGHHFQKGYDYAKFGLNTNRHESLEINILHHVFS